MAEKILLDTSIIIDIFDKNGDRSLLENECHLSVISIYEYIRYKRNAEEQKLLLEGKVSLRNIISLKAHYKVKTDDEVNIIIEDKAHNTYENVIFTKHIIELNKWNKILLVSAPYHMKRCALVMKKNAPKIKVIFFSLSSFCP